jgi:hypothetical protein
VSITRTKILIVAAALLSQTAGALAGDYIRTYRFNGETTRVQCSRVYGCTVTTDTPRTNDARVIAVPDYTPPNINDTWGSGCPSCADLSRPSAKFEAGR